MAQSRDLGGIRVTINGQGIRECMSTPELWAEMARRAEAIKDACNGDSSWGGYESGLEERNWRASANVWTIDNRGLKDEQRWNRLLRNVDAGRL